MKLQMKNSMRLGMVALACVAALACSNEITRSASPVQLVVTNTQSLQHIDLLSGATGCNQNVGTIEIQALLKDLSNNVDQRFNDVRIRSYSVTYRRTDGGTQVPAPFVRTMDLLVPANGNATGLGNFIILQTDAVTQAPFAALIPSNGGRDPETGRPVVQMEVTVQVFGETLAGANVSGTTRFPLDFCYDCGGCS